MDGIFGVGVAEVVLIGLVLFIIGGPENTAKWARELGRWVRKGREAWADVMAQLENELGDEGKEIVDAAREVGHEMRELRSMTSPSGMMRSALETDVKAVLNEQPAKSAGKSMPAGPETEAAGATEAVDEAADDAPAKSSHSPRASHYAAWTPPDDTAG